MSEPVTYEVRGPVAVITMDKPPVNLGCGDRSKCMGVGFLKNDRIRISVRQTITSLDQNLKAQMAIESRLVRLRDAR